MGAPRDPNPEAPTPGPLATLPVAAQRETTEHNSRVFFEPCDKDGVTGFRQRHLQGRESQSFCTDEVGRGL